MNALIMRQKNMERMLIALLPLLILGIFLFGWRVLIVVLTANLFAFFSEFLFQRTKKNARVSMSVFVTGSLLGLSLPPTIPLWMTAVGAVVAVTFGKMVFGGFGMNPFNPAIVGRTFIYISFASEMTMNWVKPFTSLPGGFAYYINSLMFTSATPMISFRESGMMESYRNLFIGFTPGSIGETSALLIIIAAIYLLLTKTAKWQPMIATTMSFLVFTWIFRNQNPFPFLLSGSILFGAVFMTTDPVSMPKDIRTIWIYGIIVGSMTAFIQQYSLFIGGFSFALLLANTFSPIFDYAFLQLKKKRVES
ncbi:MAG: RnfABCDGE type electron transport complex subunit D [Candidatus Cloacimonetes bacterium]|nr:RnfABCDGE type electron transport complex subunit D [Candidatus Cloacimonadota bacterium]